MRTLIFDFDAMGAIFCSITMDRKSSTQIRGNLVRQSPISEEKNMAPFYINNIYSLADYHGCHSFLGAYSYYTTTGKEKYGDLSNCSESIKPCAV